VQAQYGARSVWYSGVFGLDIVRKIRVSEFQLDAGSPVRIDDLRFVTCFKTQRSIQQIADLEFMFGNHPSTDKMAGTVFEKIDVVDCLRIRLKKVSNSAIVIRIVVGNDQNLNRINIPL